MKKSKVRLSLTFLLNEDISPDLFAKRVVDTTSALHAGEGVVLPSDASLILRKASPTARVSPTPEQKNRLRTVIALSTELTRIREATDEGRELGEEVILAIMLGQWSIALDIARTHLVFTDTKLTDLWAWFRITVLSEASRYSSVN